MGGKRSNWGPKGESIFVDGLRRGLVGTEIAAAMQRAGVTGASPATVKRRMREHRGPVRSSSAYSARLANAPSSTDSGVKPLVAPEAQSGVGVAADAHFTGDASLVVANAKGEIAQVDGELGALLAKHDALEVFLGFYDEGLDAHGQRRATGGRYRDVSLALASPTSLATLALYATEDVRTGREDNESDEAHDAFLEAHEADHVARARKLLRDALAAIPAAHASCFTAQTEEKAP